MKKEKSEGYWEIGDKKTNKPTEVIAWLMVEKAKLEEENKKLKSDLAYERTMLDNVRAEYKSLQNVIKNLKEERDKYYAEWHLRHS